MGGTSGPWEDHSIPPSPPDSHPSILGQAPPQQQPSRPASPPVGTGLGGQQIEGQIPLQHPSRTLGNSCPLLMVTQDGAIPSSGAVVGHVLGAFSTEPDTQKDLRAHWHRALICPFPSMCGHRSVLGALASQSSELLPELPAVSDKFPLS